MAEWSEVHNSISLVNVVFQGSSPGMTILITLFSWKQLNRFLLTNFVFDKIDQAQILKVEIMELKCYHF